MVDARCVSDDDGRSVVSFSFLNSLEELSLICAHCDLRDIDVAVAHCHHAEVLLLGPLACCRELCDRAGRCRLGSLTACVGVDFCVEYQDVDIRAGCDDMVETAVADIVRPTVAAEDPDGFLDQMSLICKSVFHSFLHGFSAVGGKGFRKCSTVLLCLLFIVKMRYPLCRCCLKGFIVRICGNLLCLHAESVSSLIVRQIDAHAELGVILKEGTSDCRALTLLIGRIREAREARCPDL